MMTTVLGRLATIQMGYTFRTALQASRNGAIAVIQMKDLAADDTVDCSALTRIDMEDPGEHHLVQPGDLIFRSRGLLSTSAILLHNPGKAVVAAPLIRMRVNNADAILPEYLNWYISQKDAQSYLTSRARGTTQKMIGVDALKDLEIALPPLEIQRSIVDLAALSRIERKLILAIAEKRQQYVQGSLNKLLKGD